MFHDLLIHCPDTPAFVAELAEKLPARLDLTDPAAPRYLVAKTPTVRSSAGTLALVRFTEAELAELEAAGLTTLQVLGTYDEVFADPAKKAIYDMVYPRTPITWTDEAGVEYRHVPPERIGVFF